MLCQKHIMPVIYYDAKDASIYCVFFNLIWRLLLTRLFLMLLINARVIFESLRVDAQTSLIVNNFSKNLTL